VPGDRDVIEAHALRRRQILGAFLQGQETHGEAWSGAPFRGILIGVVLAIAIAVVIGIVALVGATQNPQPRSGQLPDALPTPVLAPLL
jgi:hypothetical protein